MKNENNDLLGSLFEKKKKKGSPCVIKNIKKLFRILCRKEHIVQVNLIIINNDHLFEGQIDHMHLNHADVAVGVAEEGSNVYHHQSNSHE